MPKRTPTLFYNINKINGMKLRSGKTINCVDSTPFVKDAFNLINIFRTCDIINHEYGTISGSSWDEVFQDHYNQDIVPIMEKMAGGRFSMDCTRIIALEKFISKWRKTINFDYTINYRNAICQKIKEAINMITKMKRNGHERFCGCSDNIRRYNEHISWEYYLARGPGFIQEDFQGIPDWIIDPLTTDEDFEKEFNAQKLSWRHDLEALLNRFKEHDKYFARVPHKTNQQTFFALSSKKTPSACALRIMSFL